jgi:ribosomal protein L37AE/L43A
MFYDKGIEMITRDSNDVFTVIMRNGQRYNFDFDGNFASPAYSYSYGLYESKKRKKQIKNDEGEIVPEKCDKCGGKVVCQIHGEPVYVCKECGKYFGTMPFPDNLNEITSELVEPDDVDL